jgi:hypothetical protein
MMMAVMVQLGLGLLYLLLLAQLSQIGLASGVSGQRRVMSSSWNCLRSLSRPRLLSSAPSPWLAARLGEQVLCTGHGAAF